MAEIILAGTSHIVTEMAYGDDGKRYRISFSIDDAFLSAKSHAAEADMLCVYRAGREGDVPCVARQIDDSIYSAVEEYFNDGKVSEASELTPLEGFFAFKAKMPYYEDMMYFYGVESRCGAGDYFGLCLTYPPEYVGTASEEKLLAALDAAAASYREELIE